MYADDSNDYSRSGRRGGCRRLITHAHRRARWRFCRKHTGVPRSRINLSRTCAKESYGERQRRRARSQSDSTSSPLAHDTFPPRLPLFYNSRREAISPVYITLILCPFRQRHSSILPIEYCYLGFDFCAYLSTTIQQGACPRVRAGSHTLYTVCTWGRFSSRQRELCSKIL